MAPVPLDFLVIGGGMRSEGWRAGRGEFGIMTAEALGRAAAAIAMHEPLPGDFREAAPRKNS